MPLTPKNVPLPPGVTRRQVFNYLNRHHLPRTVRNVRKYAKRIAKRNAIRDEQKRYLAGKEVAVTEPSYPWQIIYGVVKVGGVITFLHTTGPETAPNQYMHVVVTIAAHEIDNILAVYFDDFGVSFDVDLTTTRPTGVVNATGIFANKVYMQINYGTDGQAALTQLLADCPASGSFAGLDSNYRQRGHAHVYFRFKYDETLFNNGLPDITFLVRGKADVVDPRTSTEAPGAANAAMVLYDYMTNTRWGLGIPTSRIDTTRANEAIDTCEELVDLNPTGTEYRYLVNGHFGADDNPADIIQDMLAAMAGELTYTEGKWNIWAGTARSAVVTLDEGDFLSELQIQTKTPRSDNFNTVRGTYIAFNNDYEETDFPIVKNDTYYVDDSNERIWEDISLPFVVSSGQAQRIAKILLEKIRQGIQVTFLAKLKAYKAEPVEWIAITNTRLGWSSKLFEVLSSNLIIDEDENGVPRFAVQMTVQETAAAIYDWNDGEETTTDLAPSTNLPPPFSAPSTPGAVIGLNARQISANVLLDWQAPIPSMFPIERYNIYKSTTEGNEAFFTSTDGTFFTYIEPVNGTWYYTVSAVDSQQNEGPKTRVSLLVSPLPDYFFYAQDYLSGHNATLVNAERQYVYDSSPLYGVREGVTAPIYRGQTWLEFFDDNSFDTVQEFIDAGYQKWLSPQVSEDSGSAEWEVDLGVTLAESTIFFNFAQRNNKDVIPTVTISYRATTGDIWTDSEQPAGSTSMGIQATNFRYIKFHIDFDVSSNDAIADFYDFYYRIASKVEHDGGTAVVSSGDSGSGGTVVTFNIQFLDVISIEGTALGNSASDRRNVVVNFTDSASPTSFKILLFDKDGVAQSGNVSWHARGIVGQSF
jgi:hypothetical protein